MLPPSLLRVFTQQSYCFSFLLNCEITAFHVVLWKAVADRIKLRQRLHITAAFFLVGIVVCSISLASAATGPKYQLVIAQGEDGSTPWSLALFHKNGLNCVSSTFGVASSQRESVGCEGDIAKAYVGDIKFSPFNVHSNAGILFFFVSPKARSVNLKVSGNWIHVEPKIVELASAQSAHFRHRVAYGLSIASRRGCVQRIVVFGGRGRRLEASPPIVCVF